MVEIPCDCNECLRMLGLYPSNGVTRRCRCRPRWNVNIDDNCIWELSGRIERTETNWTAYSLLNDHICDPSLIKKQDNTPAFPLIARTQVMIHSYDCVARYVHTWCVIVQPGLRQTDQTALLIQPLVPH